MKEFLRFFKCHRFIAGSVGVLFLCVYILFGCAGTSLDPSALEGKQLGKFLVSTWNKSEASFQNQVLWPNLTADESRILKGKREVIVYSYDGVSDAGDYIETGDIVPDATINRILNLLDRLQRDWLIRAGSSIGAQSVLYGDAKKLRKASDADIRKVLVEAGIISEFEAQMSPVLIGSLIELIRSGIHAAITLLEMRNETEEQIAAWWGVNWPVFQAYDLSKLPIVP